MVPTRRRLLRTAAATTATAVAGCAATDFTGSEPAAEYVLTVDSAGASPVAHAIYEPDDGALFGDPARAALDGILPDGRHTTYGYEPLPDGAYVHRDGTYYRIASVVTGRKRLPRLLVRVDPLPEDRVPEDAVLIDTLPRPSARALKMLHTHAQTDGETGTADLLRGDAYVLRRPAERESRLATGDLDGRVVTMTESGSWAYRVEVARERIVEPAHTALALPVADSRSEFRDVVFAARVDAELAPDALSRESRERLEQAVARGTYAETEPVSEPFDALLDALGLGAVDDAVNGRLLWYDGELHRYGLYVSEPS
ncbi:hypothetical protein [Haloplanus halophilus]|uniref:hypothetical protein n=1 Tax=Haloplanus halophilus TaxID=2949993 RepID=UPI0020420532|nr:hypothetical protein [Haloplanus sp. GDY1]